MTWCASVSAAAFVFSQCEIDFSFVLTLFKLSKKILKKKRQHANLKAPWDSCRPLVCVILMTTDKSVFLFLPEFQFEDERGTLRLQLLVESCHASAMFVWSYTNPILFLFITPFPPLKEDFHALIRCIRVICESSATAPLYTSRAGRAIVALTALAC